MSEKIFVLGVGAQKAGTTWLHSYIANNEKSDMGPLKEYHIWDAVDSPLCEYFKLQGSQLFKYNKEEYLRYYMQEVPGFYEGFFNSIFNSGAEITGDITPSYSVLSENSLRKLKSKIELTGAKIRCIFLMRDPVERCWSAIRHAIRNGERVFDEHEYLMRQEQSLQKWYSTEEFESRTRYEVICERLQNVFTEEEMYFGFYETMFDDAELKRLSRFLGIPVDYEYRDRYFNVSPKKSSISKALYNEVRHYYSDTYDYCFKNFKAANEIFNGKQ